MRRQKPPLDKRIHSILVRGFGLRTRDFSHEGVERAMGALNQARGPLPPMIGEVLWMSAPIAFTLPGHYVYISRSLIEYCASDAAVALVLAHEIGHHDLGHLDRADRWLATEALVHTPQRFAILVLEVLSRWLYSRERELAADAYALDLSRKAGFDPKQCLQCLDVLTRYALDHHDFDGVYGSDAEIELDPAQATNSVDRLYIEARLWFARHRRSHPSLYERRRALLKQIAAKEQAGA
jgi:predicted Zn-dependent protease